MRAVSRPLVWLLIAGFLFGVLIVLGGAYATHGQERILPGVQLPVTGTALGGLNRADGLAALSELEKKIAATPLKIHYQNQNWQLAPQKIDLRLDREALIDAALNAGRDVPWWRRWLRQREIRQHGFVVPLMVTFNKESFFRQLDALGREVSTPPRDAAFRVRADDTIEIIRGKDGMEVDKQKAYRDLLDALRAGRTPDIQLSLVKVSPRMNTEAVKAMGVKGLLSSYTTSFDPSYTERAYNIRVAAAALDGILVPPGQEVSFNKVVGPRSSEAGYKNAKVIVNNQLVDGLGGGVCQVSTTLYNAVLLANLQILERTNHSLPVSYVPIGRDATVSYGYIDFKFRNDTESYIYLRSAVNGGQVNFKIYGNTDYKVPVEIRTAIIATKEPGIIRQPDPTLKKGEQVVKQNGARGFTVRALRIIRENGEEQKETLPESKYDAVNKIIAVGTAKPSTEPVVPPVKPQPQDKQKKSQTTPPADHGGAAGPEQNQNPNDNGGIPEEVYGH